MLAIPASSVTEPRISLPDGCVLRIKSHSASVRGPVFSTTSTGSEALPMSWSRAAASRSARSGPVDAELVGDRARDHDDVVGVLCGLDAGRREHRGARIAGEDLRSPSRFRRARCRSPFPFGPCPFPFAAVPLPFACPLPLPFACPFPLPFACPFPLPFPLARPGAIERVSASNSSLRSLLGKWPSPAEIIPEIPALEIPAIGSGRRSGPTLAALGQPRRDEQGERGE